MTVENDALKGLYLEGAAFKVRIIDCLTAAGLPVHSVRHTGEFHVVQIPTPPYLRDPHLFAGWEKKRKPADGVPAAEAVPAGKQDRSQEGEAATP